jgi:hypothetical protein
MKCLGGSYLSALTVDCGIFVFAKYLRREICQICVIVRIKKSVVVGSLIDVDIL